MCDCFLHRYSMKKPVLASWNTGAPNLKRPSAFYTFKQDAKKVMKHGTRFIQITELNLGKCRKIIVYRLYKLIKIPNFSKYNAVCCITHVVSKEHQLCCIPTGNRRPLNKNKVLPSVNGAFRTPMVKLV